MLDYMDNYDKPEVTIEEPVVPKDKDRLDGYLEKYRAYDNVTADKLNLNHIKDLQEKYDNGQLDPDLSREDIANTFKDLEDTTEIPSDDENRKQAGILSRTVWAGMRDAVLNANELLPELPYLKDIGVGGSVVNKTREQVANKIEAKSGIDAAHPQGIMESIGKSFAQFNAAFIPTYKLVSKGIKNPIYAGVVSGAISSFLAFKGSDGSIVDLGEKFPDIYKHIPDFIKGKEGESELKARLRNTITGDIFGAAQAKIINSIVSRVKLAKDKMQTDEAIIHFQKRKDGREDLYDKSLRKDKILNSPIDDRQPKMSFKQMNELAQKSSLTKEQLLQNKIPDHVNISKTKYEFIGDKVKGIQIRDEAFNQFSSAIPEYRALLKNGVDGTADNILDEISKLKNIDEAVKNLTDAPEAMAYASQTGSTGIINKLQSNWQRFENRDKDKVASLLLDMAELKDPQALKSYTDGMSKTAPELFSQVFLDHANYSTLSGMSTHSVAAISNSVIDPFVWSPLQKTVAAGLSTVRDVVSSYNIMNRIKKLSKYEIEELSPKLKNREFLENYIGRKLNDKEQKAFSVGKLKLEEVAKSALELPASVKDDFVNEIANQKIHKGIVGYFTETPGKDTYLKEVLIGLKAETQATADILIHTAKTMAKQSEHKYSFNDWKNPGELVKAGVKDVVAKTARAFMDEETLKHVDNLESIASKASKMRIDKGIETEGVTRGSLDIVKHRMTLDPSWKHSASYLLAQTTTWLRKNTIDPNAILSTIDDVGKGAAQHSTIKQAAYARAMKEGLSGSVSEMRQQEIISSALKRADGDFMYASDDFIREVQKQAINKGEIRTFTNAPEEGVFKTLFYDLPNKLDNATSKIGIPLGSIMMLFKRTPLNMLTWAFDKLPTASLTTRFQESLKSGGRAADDVMASWILGSVVMGGAYFGALDRKIYGSGAGNKSELYRETLHEPRNNAIKIGDGWLSLSKLQPYSTLLTYPATLIELSRLHPEHSDDPDVEHMYKQVWSIATLGIGNLIKDFNNMRGAGEMLKTISSGNIDGMNILLESFAASMIVPNSINQFTKHIQEHTQLADDLVEKIKIRLGMGTVDKTTFFGEPMNKPKDIVPGFLPFEYYPLYEKDNNSTIKKILKASQAAGYPLISPKNIHGESLHRYTPKQYQKMIDILNNGEHMMSNVDYYSSIMLDSNGDYNHVFMDMLVADNQIDKTDEIFNRQKYSLQQKLKGMNTARVQRAKFILKITDAEVRKDIMDATEKRFAKSISIDRNLQNIVGPNNVK